MSNSLGNLMRQLSVENNDEANLGSAQEQVGAEEILVVTDEATTELEESIEELAENVNDVANSEAAVEKVIEATESLESNMALLNSMIESGQKLSGPAFAIWDHSIRDSFEARYIDESIWGNELNSLQTSFESNVEEDYSVEALDKLKAVGARIMEMLKAAWKYLSEAWTRLWTSVTASASKLDVAAEKLEEAVSKLDNSQTANGTIAMKPYSLLFESSGQDSPLKVAAAMVKQIEAAEGVATTMATNILAAKAALETDKEGVTTVEHGFTGQASFRGPNGVYVLKVTGKRFGKGEKVDIEVTPFKPLTGEATPLSIQQIGEMAKHLRDIAKASKSTAEFIKANKLTRAQIGEIKSGNVELAAAIVNATRMTDKVVDARIVGALNVGKKAYSFAVQSLKAHGKPSKVEKKTPAM